nr:hypothetical protein [Armatimonas sp.]
MALFRPLHIGLATSAAFLASTAFAQSTGKLLFDLSNFSNQSTANLSASSGLLSNLTFQTYDGNQMQTVKGGAGLLKTQYAQGSQAAFDLSRNDWFYTLCVEPTAWLINGATSEISTTKDWQQPWKTPSDPKAGDSLALLYHNFGNRTPAFAGSPLVANTVGEQVGLQVAFWEIVNDFDSTKTDFGLDLSKGLFNFKFAYADGSTNRQEIVDNAGRYLTYAKDTLQSGKDISVYQAQFFHVENTVNSHGNRQGQDVVGGQSLPEPGTLAFALLGLLPLATRYRKK